MKRVLLVQPILSHYRESLFNLLIDDDTINFLIVAGKDINGVKEFRSKDNKRIVAGLKNVSFNFAGKTFYFQKGLWGYTKKFRPTNIILGGPDFHFISTLFMSFYIILFTKIKIHYWTHGFSKNKSLFIKWILKFLYSRACSIFTYEKNGKNHIANYLGIEKKKIIIVKNCLNDWDYGFNTKQTIDVSKENNKLKILFSGRLTRKKRVDILLKAIHKLSLNTKIPIECIIIGDGSCREELEILTDKLGIKQLILFKGEIYDKDVREYFINSNIFVLPGKVGLSIIHALSYGLPVITTSLPIHSPEFEILTDNYNAFLYDSFSYSDLAKKLELIYDKMKNSTLNTDNCIDSIIEKGYTPHAMKECFINGISNY